MRRSVFLLPTLMVLSACESITVPGVGPVEVATLEATYERSNEGAAEVSFKVTNHGIHTVYVGRCGEKIATVLERDGPAGWEETTPRACFSSLDLGPVGAAPHETLSGQIEVGEPGLYRLRLAVGSDPQGPLEWTKTSNAFQVH